MNLTLQVISRTESTVVFNGDEKRVFHAMVVLRGSDATSLSAPVAVRVTQEEFDAMSPGNVFRGELALFNRGPL